MDKSSKLINCILETGQIQNFYLPDYKGDYTIVNLRAFHNLIKKRIYLQNASLNKHCSLLDLACGKGGDIQKWLLLKNYNYILALDINSGSIKATKEKNNYEGAISRWNNIKKTILKPPYIRFEIMNLNNNYALQNISRIDNNKLYDTISCQFALHYFAENLNTLENIFLLVSSKLKKGGKFIGTATNGDLIKKILDINNVNIPLLSLLKDDLNINSYLFYINDQTYDESRKSYFKLEGVSKEFYLLKENIKTIISKPNINLKIDEFKSFYEWYNDPIITQKLKQYNNYPLSSYEMIISFLNFSFVFTKN